MRSHSLTPLTTMPHTGPVEVCTPVPASQAGAATALFDAATASATTTGITQASKTLWKTDLLIASSSLRSNRRSDRRPASGAVIPLSPVEHRFGKVQVALRAALQGGRLSLEGASEL